MAPCCRSATSIVVDEAHHLEEEATRAFTVTVTPGRVQSLLAQHRLREQPTRGPAAAARRPTPTWDALARAARHPRERAPAAARSPSRKGCAWPPRYGTLRPASSATGPLNMEGKEEQLYEKLVKRAGSRQRRASSSGRRRRRSASTMSSRSAPRAARRASRRSALGCAALGRRSAEREALRPHTEHRHLRHPGGGRQLHLFPRARRADRIARNRAAPHLRLPHARAALRAAPAP